MGVITIIVCILIKIPIFFIGQKHTQQIHLVGKRWGRNQQSPYINAWVKQQYWRHLVEYLLWSSASTYDSPKGIFHFILSKKGAFNNYMDQIFSTLPNSILTPRMDKNGHFTYYRTCAIITRSWLETALVYKPRILGLKNEEFPILVHKLSVI